MKRNLIRDLDDTVIQIIGIEFTVQTESRGRQELAMFSPQNLIIPRLRTDPRGNYCDQYFPAITWHTTDGDFTLDSRNSGQWAPW